MGWNAILYREGERIMRNGRWIGLAVGWLMISSLAPFADVRPNALFSEGMVLQQGKPIPVWGTADEGEMVHVSLGDQRVATVARDGRWMVTLNPMKAGGPHTMIIEGKNDLVFENVLVGEVWIGSGQSNMQWTVANSNNAEQEIAQADCPNIRLFSVPRTVAGRPQKDVNAKWEVCTPQTVPNFSAVLYFFGRELHKNLNVPVGLIHTSWGGTPAESWTTRETLLGHEKLKGMVERWDKMIEDFDNQLDQYAEKMIEWEQNADQAEAEGRPVPAPPEFPRDPRNQPWRPAGLYNAMIAPLIPYAIQGAIWYQGESNASRAYQYRILFPAMIQDWRDHWGQGDFPFLFVQLANFIAGEPEEPWAELREAQTMALSLPNTGMAVTIDIGNPTDIHPRNKQDVGYRLALAARKIAYGQEIVYSGPIYDSMTREDGRVRIRFQHVGSGLMAKNNEPLKGFTIADSGRKFVPAGARIEGDTVVVWSDEVKDPVAVRYGWKHNPDCNLYNKEGLPASPFRTDDWPGVTINNE